MNRTCANCGRRSPKNQQMYSIKIEMYARAEPLVFSQQEMEEDSTPTLHELVKMMENCDPEEAAAQVHESYTFDLCARCRKRLHHGLKAKSKQAAKNPS